MKRRPLSQFALLPKDANRRKSERHMPCYGGEVEQEGHYPMAFLAEGFLLPVVDWAQLEFRTTHRGRF